MMSEYDIKAAFIAAMADAGITPSKPEQVIPDGQLHRYNVQGDKPGTPNGWYTLHTDGLPAGAFGSWKTGVFVNWCAKERNNLTNDERLMYRLRMDAIRQAREAETRQRHTIAAAKAADLWGKGNQADRSHPYLIKKRVKAHSARQLGESLLLAIGNMQGQLRSLQFIQPDGAKRLLSGGEKKGNFIYVAGSFEADTILICEGFATGASLSESNLDALVIASIDAGNLEPVAVAVRKYRPDTAIVICCDADTVGIAKGRAAAIAAGAQIAIPEFPPGTKGSDFNDLAVSLAVGGAA